MQRTLWQLALCLLAVVASAGAVAAATPVRVHALAGARLVLAPGKVVPEGTVVVRDGVIEAAGAGVTAPADARVWDVKGLTIYPGLIEAYAVRSVPEKKDTDKIAASHPNPLVQADRDMASYAPDEAATKKFRDAGFTTAVVAPKEGLFRGRSALLNLGDGDLARNLLRQDVAQNVALRPASGENAPYPESLMGAVALFRQTLLDVAWHQQAHAVYSQHPGQPRPAWTPALSALEPVLTGRELVVFETDHVLDTLRDAALAREFHLSAWIVGNGEEYQRLAAVKATRLPHILPLNFPKAPEPAAPTGDANIELGALRHWDQAPENPQRLLETGLEVAFSTSGLDQPAKVFENLARAMARGLTAEQALAGFTTTPAQLLGIADRAGTLQPGRMANLVVVEGDLFVAKPKIREVWVDGDRYEVKEPTPPAVAGADAAKPEATP